MCNNKSLAYLLLCALILLMGVGCATTAEQHQSKLPTSSEREMTVGIVQKEIYSGMPQSDVAQALGSPNIVSRDSAGKETWIYDKIATEAYYSTSSSGYGAGVGAGGLAGSALILGGITGSSSNHAGASASTQKTLTVIIKFNDEHVVDSFSYHSSKF